MAAERGAEDPLFEPGPVGDPRAFYGRSAETRRILGLLSRMQNCSVTGPPRIGKTSLLLHLARPETWRAHGVDRSRCAPVYITFEEFLSHSAEEIFHILACETINVLVAERLGGNLRVSDGPF